MTHVFRGFYDVRARNRALFTNRRHRVHRGPRSTACACTHSSECPARADSEMQWPTQQRGGGGGKERAHNTCRTPRGRAFVPRVVHERGHSPARYGIQRCTPNPHTNRLRFCSSAPRRVARVVTYINTDFRTCRGQRPQDRTEVVLDVLQAGHQGAVSLDTAICLRTPVVGKRRPDGMTTTTRPYHHVMSLGHNILQLKPCSVAAMQGNIVRWQQRGIFVRCDGARPPTDG